MNIHQTVDVLLGLQWGSEGKGKFAALMSGNYDIAVRSGGPNAGHTIYYNGKKLVCHMVPCAFVNPEVKLYISAGAAVNLDKLNEEIDTLERESELSIRDRLFVDPNTAVIMQYDINNEAGLQENIGSTVQGVGSAIARKASRSGRWSRTIGEYDGKIDVMVGHVAPVLHAAYRSGKRILLEGTQGAGLSLDHGDYPFCTSKNTITSGLLADAGLPPQVVKDVYGVVRTYPIRVAGNSGPMGIEITWDEVARRGGLDEVPMEITTVTKRVRRVALQDYSRLKRACDLCGVTKVIVTFADYIDPTLLHFNPTTDSELIRHDKIIDLIARIGSATGVGIHAVSYGPKPEQTVMLNSGGW